MSQDSEDNRQVLAPEQTLEYLRVLADIAPPLWLTGGVAVDFLVGEVDTATSRPRCGAEGEWSARVTSGTLVPGRTMEPKIRHDLELLEALVPAVRRQEIWEWISGSRSSFLGLDK